MIAAADIAEFMGTRKEGPIGVLLSGDVGFYSGAKSLWPLLERYEVETFPGISSLSYFCARPDLLLGHGHVPPQEPLVRQTGGVPGADQGAGVLCQQHRQTVKLLSGQLRRRTGDDALIRVAQTLSYGNPQEIVDGTAPEALKGLPAPDRVFLGGTSGSLEEILRHSSPSSCRLRWPGR